MNIDSPTKDRCLFLLSFNRPEFLRETLDSLRKQTVGGWRIFLFQDGPREDHAQEDLHSIGKCEDEFCACFPEGTVIRHPRNIGIGLNMLAAQEHAFRALQCDVAYFFEDDLVLHKSYLDQLFRLEEILRPHRMQIPYFAAYGGVHTIPLPASVYLSDDLRFLEHFWGYGLFRDPWEDEQNLLKPYFDYLSGVDYTRRDHHLIRGIFHDLGWSHRATSQDGARTMALCSQGRCGVTTRQPLARYIGASGVHWSRRDFNAWGFPDVTPAEDAEPVTPALPEHLLKGLGEQFRRWVGEMQDLPQIALQRALDRTSSSPGTKECGADHHLEAEVAHFLRRIRAMEASTSWRITHPTRWVTDLVLKILGKIP